MNSKTYQIDAQSLKQAHALFESGDIDRRGRNRGRAL